MIITVNKLNCVFLLLLFLKLTIRYTYIRMYILISIQTPQFPLWYHNYHSKVRQGKSEASHLIKVAVVTP